MTDTTPSDVPVDPRTRNAESDQSRAFELGREPLILIAVGDERDEDDGAQMLARALRLIRRALDQLDGRVRVIEPAFERNGEPEQHAAESLRPQRQGWGGLALEDDCRD
jgi:hypothetical protein